MKNVLAAGGARLQVDGSEVELADPRLIREDEAFQALSDDVKRPPRLLRITEFLRMNLVAG